MRRRTPLIAALLLLAPSLASAQPAQDVQATKIRDAFNSAYGQALSAELGKSLRDNADPACVASKGIETGQLEARGRDIMIKWGARLIDGTDALIDQKVYADKFPAAAELDRLQANTDVKKYLALAAPMQQAKVLDTVFEQFDRYAKVGRIKLSAVSPLATGNDELLRKNPAEATEDALEAFSKRNKSKALKRFLDLSEQAAAARSASIAKDRVPPGAPLSFLKGLEVDLAELCIGSGR
ncbi:hypothetical protein [Bradyrhizobium sp. USDA 4454]